MPGRLAHRASDFFELGAPVRPLLARWSAHRRHAATEESEAVSRDRLTGRRRVRLSTARALHGYVECFASGRRSLPRQAKAVRGAGAQRDRSRLGASVRVY